MTTDVVERHEEADGAVFELRKRPDSEILEVYLEGRRLFVCPERRYEQSLVEVTMAPLVGRDDITVLLGGLSQGFVLRAILDTPGVKRVDLVEPSSAVLAWQGRHFAAHSNNVLSDPRVVLHQVALKDFLAAPRPSEVADGWMAVVVDVDQGPSSLHRPQNLQYYNEEGVAHLVGALRPGGVLTAWAAMREREFLRHLNSVLQNVAEIAVPVEIDGQSSLDYLYRGRRPAPSGATVKAAN